MTRDPSAPRGSNCGTSTGISWSLLLRYITFSCSPPSHQPSSQPAPPNPETSPNPSQSRPARPGDNNVTTPDSQLLELIRRSHRPPRHALLALAAACLLAVAHHANAQATCTAIGSERWTVKIAAPVATHRTRHLDPTTLAALPVPKEAATYQGRMLDRRYASSIRTGLHEGDLATVRGWVQRIKTSSDDCDYHVELTPSQHDLHGMVIVELPPADSIHILDSSLRAQVAAARALLRQQLRLSGEPSRHGNAIGGRAYMEFSGALFFDGIHSPHCELRGSGAGAATCWELHPVIAARFVPRPHQ